MSNKTPSDQSLEELRERLAAIEHERWASWQIWCNRVIREAVPNNPALEKLLKGWDRQINLPYQLLTDREKASDMEQVDRYWPLIQGYVARECAKARAEGYDEGFNRAEHIVKECLMSEALNRMELARIAHLKDKRDE